MTKILIIEDDHVVANIYRNRLTVEGFKVEAANDGEEGYELAGSFKPDAIVLDLLLPKISGIDLLKKLRAEAEFTKTPIIVFSNTYLTNMVQAAWKAGATKCLSKANSSPREVVEIIRRSLNPLTPRDKSAVPETSSPVPDANGAGSPQAAASSTANGDAEAKLRAAFLAGAPGSLATLRGPVQGLIKADSDTGRQEHTHELYRSIHALTGNAGVAGFTRIAQMSDALEALLRELYEMPGNINASTLRTVASAIDFLSYLFEHATQPDRPGAPQPNILVVDDEAISRRAVTYALEKARLKSVNVEDPNIAYKMLSENYFDLIFLDVDMPGMDGFQLCTKLRALPFHKKTPVVFVTGLNDFNSRANSTVSGGNDFIAKPFLFIELAVKALVHVFRRRIEVSKGSLSDRF